MVHCEVHCEVHCQVTAQHNRLHKINKSKYLTFLLACSWRYLFSLFKNSMRTTRASWSVTEHATLQFLEAAIREKTPNLSVAKIAQSIAETGNLHEKNATQIWRKIRKEDLHLYHQCRSSRHQRHRAVVESTPARLTRHRAIGTSSSSKPVFSLVLY